MPKFVYYARDSLDGNETTISKWWDSNYPAERDHLGIEKNNVCVWCDDNRIPLKTFYRKVDNYRGMGPACLLVGKVRTMDQLMLIRLNFGYPLFEE